MWIVRPWPNDPSVAHLIFTDHLNLPTRRSIEAAVQQARKAGALTVRTSAIFPRLAELLGESDFETIDRLVLLRRQLEDPIASSSPRITHHVRPFRAWHLPRAAEVDQEAFGLMWGNDTASLGDIRRATPHNRARLVRYGRNIAGFAISGAATGNGYVQRLSIGSPYRRRHIANALVVDALRWMRTRGLTAALVNTGVTNAAALSLYDGLGFEPLDDELVIAERRLNG